MNGLSAEERGYRPCAGIMLLNSANQVWVGRRLDMTSHAWQMPQGGIDPGETAEAAARRELEEETGVAPALAEIVAASRDWYQYDLPPEMLNNAWGGRYKGQRQRWYVMRFLGRDNDIKSRQKSRNSLNGAGARRPTCRAISCLSSAPFTKR